MNRKTINQFVREPGFSTSGDDIFHVINFLSANLTSKDEISEDAIMILAQMEKGVNLITALEAYTHMGEMLKTPAASRGIADYGLDEVKKAFYTGSVFDLQNPLPQFGFHMQGGDEVFNVGSKNSTPHLETTVKQRQSQKFPDVKQYLSQVIGAGTVQQYLALR